MKAPLKDNGGVWDFVETVLRCVIATQLITDATISVSARKRGLLHMLCAIGAKTITDETISRKDRTRVMLCCVTLPTTQAEEAIPVNAILRGLL